ncbi:MAG: hypothetical protein JSV09_08035 [Thermoplasmata archaeon]|nr:MAG: hypothetical protein JSV09_08035 [Thermoplasmata archaeon]
MVMIMKIPNSKKWNPFLYLFKSSPISRIILLFLYVLLLTFTAIFGVYLITYFLFIFVFLLIASNMEGFGIIKKLETLPRWQNMALIFAFALILRGVILLQTQVITPDLDRFVARSQNMLDGQLPYRDFYGGNKPPLYEFMLYLVGFLFGPGAVQFRAVFSGFDAAIPVLIFLICIDRYNTRFALISSLTYAIFPISIICMGLSGHYDSVVVSFSLLSILLLLQNRFNSSALSLGVAFALKIYPIVLVPFFISTIKTWRARILYILLFSIPTLVVDGMLYLLSPSAFFGYLTEESGWMGVTSIPITIEMIFNATEIFGIKISWVVLGIFGLLILWLIKDWYSPKRDENLIKWFKIIILLFVIHYGFYILFGLLYYDVSLNLALIVVLIFFSLMFLVLPRYLFKIVPKSLVEPKSEGLFVVSTFAIMLFLFGLPSYAPWYFIWFFPFLLVIKTDKIRYSLLWIFPWHGIGENMSLLPGTPKVN